ncbi:MAG: hypothetical protein IJG50_06580 [Clostridia bacterium]|nr:hypothetical protein [Clostridia bacterium]
MFGYVLPHKPELKVKEYEYYKSVYCGLCKQMGARCGCISRFFLSYDSAFMALSRMAVTGAGDSCITKGRCVINPFKKVHYCHSKHIDYCADVSVLLVWHKIKDDIFDKKFPKNIPARLLSLIMALPHRRASKSACGSDERIARSMDELHKLEEACSPNMDEAAETFFSMLADVMAAHIDDKTHARVAYEIGKNVGRWIYILDAYNDIEQDLKSSDYNPLIYRYNKKDDEDAASFAERIRADVDDTLAQCIYNLSITLDFCKSEDAVLKNIVNMGLSEKQFMILYPEEYKKKTEQSGTTDSNPA